MNNLPDNPQTKPQTLRPFTKFCMSIGAIPSSYLNSLSYYETLLWLINFLEKTIIPAMENSFDAITELQELYIELKNYIDNYFNTTDFQQQINNKLDEMAENGTLANIINNFTINCILSFKTVNKMIENNFVLKNSVCKTLGYYNENDNGGAYYLISDEKTNYSIELENGLFANFINPNNLEINVKQFGCLGDGISDDYTHFSKLINYACTHECIILNNSNILLKHTLQIPKNEALVPFTIKGNGSFKWQLENIKKTAFLIWNDYGINILGNLTFDFQNFVFQGLEIHTISNNFPNCNIEGKFQNVRRASTQFVGGNIIDVSGSFNLVTLKAIIKNASLAKDAGVSYAQGIAGVTIGRYTQDDISFSPKTILIKNGTIIKNIYGEDPNYTLDQDGIKLFGDENTIAIIEEGVIIKDCSGRWVKTQVGFSNISGRYFAENKFPVNGGIDIQQGQACCHDCYIYNNYSEQDPGSYGTCIFRYTPSPYISSNRPREISIWKNINYYASSLNNTKRIRKIFLLAGQNNLPLSNCIIENVNVYGSLYEFAQISPENSSLSTNISLKNCFIYSLVDNLIDMTKSLDFNGNSFANVNLENITISQGNNSINHIKLYENCYAYINQSTNLMGFRQYNTSMNIFEDSNGLRYAVPKNILNSINFLRTNSINNDSISFTGRQFVINNNETIIIPDEEGRYNHNFLMFIIDTTGLEAGIIASLCQTLQNRQLYLLNGQGISLEGSNGLVISLDNNKNIQITNHNKSSRILSIYKMS